MKEKVADVFDYWPNVGPEDAKVNVAGLTMTGNLKKGDKISIERGEGEVVLEQVAGSMQIRGQDKEEVNAGDSVGMKVDQPVQKGDVVYKITE
jgi:hypothetical protein